MRIIKTVIPLFIMVLANLSYFYYERRLSKESERAAYRNAYRNKHEIDIVETVIRWEIEKHLMALRENQGTACISTVRNLAQDSIFISRFSDMKIRLKDENACESIFETGVVDKETGKPSVSIFVSGVRWEKDDSVVVGSGYHSGNLGGSSGTVTVVLKSNGWKVVWENVEIISQNKSHDKIPNTVTYCILTAENSTPKSSRPTPPNHPQGAPFGYPPDLRGSAQTGFWGCASIQSGLIAAFALAHLLLARLH